MYASPDAFGEDPFPPTRWSIVARSADESPAMRGKAWNTLFQTYWIPLYAYVRRRGYSEIDAEDLTQGFFSMLAQRGPLSDVDASRGKLRAYLLTALKNHLVAQHRKEHSLKRGGGMIPLSLDVDEAEARLESTTGPSYSPDVEYDRQWALQLIEETLLELEREYTEKGKGELFQAFRPHISVTSDRETQQGIADQLGMKAGAVRIAVYRLRQRFATIMRQKIKETVLTEDEVEEELSYLMRVFSVN